VNPRGAIVSGVQDLKPGKIELRLSDAALEDDGGTWREPASGEEFLNCDLSQPGGVRRVDECEIEWGAIGPWSNAQIRRIAAMDARHPKERHRLNVLADRTAGGLIGFNEEAKGCASRQSLKSKSARPCKEIDDPPVTQAL